MLVVDVAVLASVAVTVVAVPRLRRRDAAPADASRGNGVGGGPGLALCLLTAAVYVNQLLFTVYVERVHGGDPSFIARYLPTGWFDLADWSLVDALARHVPAPELLAPSVLRVQAFLELPFVLLAYLVVMRWLDRGLYRRLATSPLLWAASASYTFAFCIVEWDLRNPYTVDNIVIRVCAAVVTPLWISWMARREPERENEPVSGGLGLLLFAASTWALGQLVLTVYDTALLYNLGHVGGRLPAALVAVAGLAAARLWARRLTAREQGAALATVVSGLRWALAFFFVPALAVRYGVTFGTPLVALAAGMLVCVTAAVVALREGLGTAGTRRIVAWCGQMAVAVVVGGLLGYAAVRLVTDTYYEAGLLRGVAVFFVAVVGICAVSDRWIAERGRGTARTPT
ncbi:hypothetical protein [Actinomadura sp. 9N407]|uniref:hypothetical protein n=1 Tax=Actinomadura sp. 9N407 TaxID=3375154 RepID=UPI00379B27E9